jgi:hypothetical protein
MARDNKVVRPVSSTRTAALAVAKARMAEIEVRAGVLFSGAMTFTFRTTCAILPDLVGCNRLAVIFAQVEPRQRVLDPKTGKPRGYCYVGACCGWGHRLMRQAKTFTHIHYIQNRTMLMEWGPCPNAKVSASS